jgi:hypothetical protein
MISNTVKNAFPMICLSRPRLPGASQSWRPPAGCPGPARGLGRAPNQRAGVAQATWTGGESDWTDDPSSGGRPGDPGLGIPRRRRSCRRKTISFRWRAPIRTARSRPGLRAEHPGSAYPTRSARPRDGRLSDKKTRVERYLRGVPVPALDRERRSRLDVVEHDPGEFSSGTHALKPEKGY